MNKNVLPIILIVLALGTYFTYTKHKMEDADKIQAVNDSYKGAIENANKLIKLRDTVRKDYNNLTDEDRDRLNKLIPDNIDNVRLIIDINNGIAARHGLIVKNIHTSAGGDAVKTGADTTSKIGSTPYNVVTVTFNVSATYNNFIAFLQDIERSLRIMDVSKITLTANENGLYDYGVELKTYWLKQ